VVQIELLSRRERNGSREAKSRTCGILSPRPAFQTRPHAPAAHHFA
jgi:hypothetical protein